MELGAAVPREEMDALKSKCGNTSTQGITSQERAEKQLQHQAAYNSSSQQTLCRPCARRKQHHQTNRDRQVNMKQRRNGHHNRGFEVHLNRRPPHMQANALRSHPNRPPTRLGS
ncbi:hypothetical protein KC19_VG207400 [Ceratodon purpureus]|uniref:Uncharacterized protein n=1 Tax=Ceratodon purpureus TaxID=3225 RepID=A0A8T0HRZ0_CERPU|nr:hypothetical protein KC19_VG207400 [Ceratodon purpureus]